MTSDPHPRDPFQPTPSTEPFSQPMTPVTPTSTMPGPAARPSKGGGSGLLINLLLGIALVVAVGGVAFAAGRMTAPAAVAATNGGGRFGNGGGPAFGGPNASGAPDRNGGFAGGLGGFGGLNIEGTVTAVSADSITIQLSGGQSVTIPIDAQTTYHTRSAATSADVTTGSTVQVQLQGGGRGVFGGGNGGNGGNGPTASGQPTRTLPAANSITLVPAGS